MDSQQFRVVFDQLDEDDDGIVELREIAKWLPTEAMQAELKTMQESAKTTVNFEEFREICSQLMSQQTNMELESDEDEDDLLEPLTENDKEEYEVVRALFDRLDKKSSGCISISDLKSLMNQNHNEEDFEKAVKQIDAPDGKLTFAEFYEHFDLFVHGLEAQDVTSPEPFDMDRTASRDSFTGTANPLLDTMARDTLLDIPSPGDTMKSRALASSPNNTLRSTTASMRSPPSRSDSRSSTKLNSSMLDTMDRNNPHSIRAMTGMTPTSSLRRDKSLFSRENERQIHLENLELAKEAEQKQKLEEDDDEALMKASQDKIADLKLSSDLPEQSDQSMSFFNANLTESLSEATALVMAVRSSTDLKMAQKVGEQKGDGSSEDEIGKLRAKCDAALEHVRTMERKYKMLARLGAKLELENGTLEERLAQTSAELADVREESAELKVVVEDISIKNESVTEHVRKLRSQNLRLAKDHEETIETLKAERRRNDNLRDELAENERRMKEQQGSKADQLRNDRMEKLRQTSGLMDVLKTKRKVKSLERALEDSEKRIADSKKNMMAMFLELKKDKEIIESLRERLRSRGLKGERRDLASELLQAQGNMDLMESKGSSGDVLTVGENLAEASLQIQKEEKALKADSATTETKSPRFQSKTVAFRRSRSLLVPQTKGDKPQNDSKVALDEIRRARGKHRRTRSALRLMESKGESVSYEKRRTAAKGFLSRLEQSAQTESENKRKLRQRSRHKHSKTMMGGSLNDIRNFYAKQRTMTKQEIFDSLREGLNYKIPENSSSPVKTKRTVSEPPLPMMPKMPTKNLKKEKSSPPVVTSPKPALSKPATTNVATSQKTISLTWRDCLNLVIKEAKKMYPRSEIAACRVKTLDLLALLDKRLGLQSAALSSSNVIISKQTASTAKPKKTVVSKPKKIISPPVAKMSVNITSPNSASRRLPRPAVRLDESQMDHVRALAQYLNNVLSGDELLEKAGILPLQVESADLIHKVSDGLLLAEYINHAAPGTIDTRAMNTEHWHDPNFHPYLHNIGGISKPDENGRKILDEVAMRENLTLVLESAKAIGAQINDIKPRHLLQAHSVPSRAIEFIFALIVARVELISTVKEHRNLIKLLLAENNNDMKSALAAAAEIGPRDMVNKWIVHHSERWSKVVHADFKKTARVAGLKVLSADSLSRNQVLFWKEIAALLVSIQHNRKIEKAGNGSSSASLTAPRRRVMSNLSPKEISWAKDAIDANTPLPLVEKLREMGAKDAAFFLIRPKRHDDTKKTRHLLWRRSFACVGLLMNDLLGLYFSNDDASTVEDLKRSKAVMMSDDTGKNRFERAQRMWINSIGIKGLHIQNLFRNGRDGIMLLKVLDHIVPGSVNWKQVKLRPRNKFDGLQNCNHVIEVGRSVAFRFKLVSIAGVDIQEGNHKLTLALVWQMMRCHMWKFLQTVYAKKHGGKLTSRTMRKMFDKGGDSFLIKWANKTIAEAINKRALPNEPKNVDWKKVSKVKSFKDPSLKQGLYFILLLWAIDDYVVNWKVVTEAKTREDCISNARYAISVARKIGATIFLLPEDITELKEKMIMTFVGGILSVAE
mmetsp:Transcript_6221/g.9528  ORF Transcript_6221/g.9528 Transcript_6221/m.9528 type:complete len:1580 (+) Transcript_6221:91-4830(+)